MLYRRENVDGIGAQDALQSVIHIAAMTAEYMTAMERAPKLQVTGLEGDYRILADFGDAVLAGHPSERGVQFVTWEWDWDRNGVHHGHYFQNGYEEAKHDFVRRSGLLPEEALFEPEQLAEMHRALTFVCKQDEDLSIGREKEIKVIMEQSKCLFSTMTAFFPTLPSLQTCLWSWRRSMNSPQRCGICPPRKSSF